jgi:putative ABC transport system permease protein
MRIVGVARDAKVRTLGEAPRPYVYQLQGRLSFIGMQVVVKGRASSAELLATAQRVLKDIDPDMVVMEAKTMNEHLAIMLFPPRMAALLLSVFGGLALTLAAIGIYGVVSHSVARRTRELGIRMSLGATAGDVVRMGVGGGMRMVLIGGGVGVVLAGAVSWALQRFLYGIGATDVVTFIAIPVLLCVVALFAAFVPARRAATVDPVRALRSE